MSLIDSATDGQLLPLQLDYQRFMQLGSRRLPQTLYMHERGYRSDTINTDALGLRYSHWAGKRYSPAERGSTARVNLLVGGSTAFGIGASGDDATVASHLSALTGEVWLSLAGCGLSATQELLLFLTHQHRLGKIGHVVILSGLNTLAQEALSELLATGSDPRQAYLNSFNETLQAPPCKGVDSLWQRLRQALMPRREQPALSWSLPPADKRLMRAADCIGRTLRQWDRLLADSHATLTFILQPLLPWCRETVPAAEQARLDALQQQPVPFDQLLAGVFDAERHSAFFRRIKNQADSVACYDMNCMLDSSPVFAQSLFVDRLHFNDLGNNTLAKVITAKLGLAQDKQRLRKVTPIKLV